MKGQFASLHLFFLVPFFFLLEEEGDIERRPARRRAGLRAALEPLPLSVRLADFVGMIEHALPS